MGLISNVFQRPKDQKYSVGIALSGGGVRGFAHLGVLKALNEKGIYPEVIAGTSAGALAGIFYADGYSPKKVLKYFIITVFFISPSLLSLIKGYYPWKKYRKF